MGLVWDKCSTGAVEDVHYFLIKCPKSIECSGLQIKMPKQNVYLNQNICCGYSKELTEMVLFSTQNIC